MTELIHQPTEHNRIGSTPSEEEEQSKFWDKWHTKINERVPNWGTHFPFAEEVLPYLFDKKAYPILELGCGQCNDSIYFAENGFDVHAIDFSPVALTKADQLLHAKGISSVTTYLRDIAAPLLFPEDVFGSVYSHLSLHYFSQTVTRTVFLEIHRVLRATGILAFNVKSIHDFRYGEGIELEPDMFNYKGHLRHFFRRESIEDLLAEWDILVLDEYEATYGGAQERSSFIKTIAQKR